MSDLGPFLYLAMALILVGFAGGYFTRSRPIQSKRKRPPRERHAGRKR